ncbi:MAG: Nif3-like dinuclear metal center hexameric protein [Pseudohongiellaceae bacterium]|nr:Nif3-like dinuclear metal center hexameric protein [Pseudohongiellaceae bacterium]
MSVSRDEIMREIKVLLRPEQFKDYCPNGLQVEGKSEIKKIVSGVTACQALIDAAIAAQADLLLVHHGYFWRGEDETLTGIKRTRVQSLLANDVNLLAYHLPLDAHADLGNNAQLGRLLGITETGDLGKQNNHSIGLVGRFDKPLTPKELSELLSERLGREPLHIDGGPQQISTVAWCTGAAQNFIDLALTAGADAYISGEISEPTVHTAREAGIHYYSAGHHATERYGVQALARHLADKFALEHEFIDIDNPV